VPVTQPGALLVVSIPPSAWTDETRIWPTTLRKVVLETIVLPLVDFIFLGLVAGNLQHLDLQFEKVGTEGMSICSNLAPPLLYALSNSKDPTRPSNASSKPSRRRPWSTSH
jgi:hypothetical protein